MSPKKLSRLAAVTMLLVGLVSATGYAREVAGVNLPETAVADGKTLKLVGAGLRTRMMFKVYAAALYAETPQKDARTLIASDQAKRVQLVLLRSLDATTLRDAIREGFENNSRDKMPTLKPRLDRLMSMFPSVKEGDKIALTYQPGKGTTVTVNNADKGMIEGKDFADALFAVWLGASPVQEDLKQALLGR